MSERLEKLRREVAAEKAAVLAELGLSFDGPLLVMGSQDANTVINTRLAKVPEPLRQDARLRMLRSMVRLPFITSRRVATGVQA